MTISADHRESTLLSCHVQVTYLSVGGGAVSGRSPRHLRHKLHPRTTAANLGDWDTHHQRGSPAAQRLTLQNLTKNRLDAPTDSFCNRFYRLHWRIWSRLFFTCLGGAQATYAGSDRRHYRGQTDGKKQRPESARLTRGNDSDLTQTRSHHSHQPNRQTGSTRPGRRRAGQWSFYLSVEFFPAGGVFCSVEVDRSRPSGRRRDVIGTTKTSVWPCAVSRHGDLGLDLGWHLSVGVS